MSSQEHIRNLSPMVPKNADRIGDVKAKRRPRWLGPISGRIYYRPAVYREKMKLTRREYERLTDAQKDGNQYIELGRRRKWRMRWLNRTDPAIWRWEVDGEVARGRISQSSGR